MTRTLVRGGAIALMLFLVALIGDTIGIDTLWPVALAAAVGVAAGTDLVGRFGAFAVGAGLGWVAFAIRAGFLPDAASARGLSMAIGVVVVTAVAAGSAERLPLWAGLAGLAAFFGLYGPIYADTPTTFLADSPSSLVSLLLAAAVGAIAVTLGDLAGPGDEDVRPIRIPDEPRPATAVTGTDTEEVRS